jgi:pimeloyl-ACP methyl ester carboxylesterase
MSQWLLLRGLTRETRHWGGFATALAAHGLTGGEQVVCIDLPGNGAEHAREAPTSVIAMMHFVRARAATLGVRMPCRVIAMSLGAMVATAWAQRHPEEIGRLVLINTSMRPFAGVHERLRPLAWPLLLGIALNWTRPGPCELMIHRLTCRRSDALHADVAQWAAWRRAQGASAVSALRQLFAAARFRAGGTPPECPVLLLSSAADRLVDPVCSTQIEAHWDAAHAVHPWAGHDLPYDDAGWTCRVILAWLGESEVPTSRMTNQ